MKAASVVRCDKAKLSRCQFTLRQYTRTRLSLSRGARVLSPEVNNESPHNSKPLTSATVFIRCYFFSIDRTYKKLILKIKIERIFAFKYR